MKIWHFNTFLSNAAQCDYIFTTDVDCISNYKSILRHNRVYMLPFAANPKIHNQLPNSIGNQEHHFMEHIIEILKSK